MGKIIPLIQGTPEWTSYRSSRIGASDSPVILGVSPFKTPFGLYEEKVHGKTTPTTPAMQRGLDREHEARKWLDNHFGTIFCPRVVEHDKHEWKFASLDALSPDGKIAVEIKFANSVVHSLAKKGKVVDFYFPQVQSQMSCCDLDSMYFLSCYQEPGSDVDFVLVKIERDRKFIDDMIEKEQEFYQKCLVELCPPELCDKDYDHVQDNLHFDYVCSEYMRINKEIAALEKEKKAHFESIISLSKGRNSKSNSFKATKFTVRGNVDYGSIEALQNVNLDHYRKESREQWKVSKN
jgi:putative phage-type endonuclease